MRWRGAALLLALTVGCHATTAGRPSSSPGSNPFTDTIAPAQLKAAIAANPDGDVAAIHRVWTNYSYQRWPYDCSPTPYWTSTEQGMMTMQNGREVPLCFDVAITLTDPRARSEVLAIDPVQDVEPRAYRLTIRMDATAGDQVASYSFPAAIITHFAVREDGQWKLASALGRLTREWHREVVGPFTYIVSPTRRFSRSRADSAVRLVDSLATAFGQPALQPTRYFVVADADEMLHISGYRTDTVWRAPGGRTFSDIIISGDSVFGEKHGHEIVHKVLSPLYGHPNLTLVASEGVPTWLGGTRGMHFPQAVRALGSYLRSNPSITLDSIIGSSNAHPVYNPAAALLTSIVHAHAGVPGIVQYLKVGPRLQEFREGVERIVGKPWSEIAAEWKRAALGAGN